MYYKNKIPSSINWGIHYTCGCAIRKGSYGKQLYFGEEYCTQGFYKRLLVAIESGEYGVAWQRMLNRHPDGTVDARLGLYVCDHCGYWSNEERMDFYIPIAGEKPKYQDLNLLANNGKYKLSKKGNHICPYCKREMREILNSISAIRSAHLMCPKCKSEIKLITDRDVTNAKQEYHDVLMAMFAQAFLLENNDMIITHLSSDVMLEVPNKKIVKKGIQEVSRYLFKQAKFMREKKTAFYSHSTISVNKYKLDVVQYPYVASVLSNYAALEYIYDDEKNGIICTGTINENGQIEHLIYLTTDDVEYDIIESPYNELMRI